MSRIGDRYKSQLSLVVLEVCTLHEDKHTFQVTVVESGNSGWVNGQILRANDNWSEFTYLGNFSKSSNYNNLYNILNGN